MQYKEEFFDIHLCFKISTFFNTGFKHNPMMTGALLSRMAQGNGIITVQHLKQMTVIYDFEDGIMFILRDSLELLKDSLQNKGNFY